MIIRNTINTYSYQFCFYEYMKSEIIIKKFNLLTIILFLALTLIWLITHVETVKLCTHIFCKQSTHFAPLCNMLLCSTSCILTPTLFLTVAGYKVKSISSQKSVSRPKIVSAIENIETLFEFRQRFNREV